MYIAPSMAQSSSIMYNAVASNSQFVHVDIGTIINRAVRKEITDHVWPKTVKWKVLVQRPLKSVSK